MKGSSIAGTANRRPIRHRPHRSDCSTSSTMAHLRSSLASAARRHWNRPHHGCCPARWKTHHRARGTGNRRTLSPGHWRSSAPLAVSADGGRRAPCRGRHRGSRAAGWCPAVPVPIFTDQPFWAQRIHQLDAAAQPIAYKQLTARRLAASIDEVLANEDLASGAQRIARRLVAEPDSSIPVARALEQLCN